MSMKMGFLLGIERRKMNIKCKVCSNLKYCTASVDSDTCESFKIGMDKLIETATELSKKYHISRGETLIAIDICLKYGGYTID